MFSCQVPSQPARRYPLHYQAAGILAAIACGSHSTVPSAYCCPTLKLHIVHTYLSTYNVIARTGVLLAIASPHITP